jgi:hypothetical protein
LSLPIAAFWTTLDSSNSYGARAAQVIRTRMPGGRRDPEKQPNS